jgi:hypothetical protein
MQINTIPQLGRASFLARNAYTGVPGTGDRHFCFFYSRQKCSVFVPLLLSVAPSPLLYCARPPSCASLPVHGNIFRPGKVKNMAAEVEGQKRWKTV